MKKLVIQVIAVAMTIGNLSIGVVAAQELPRREDLPSALFAKGTTTGKLLDRAYKLDTKACFHVGRGFLQGGDGFPRNSSIAVAWLRSNACQDSYAAKLLLGNVYLRGMGVAKDELAAFEIFDSLARRGDAPAMFILAGLYADGVGTPRNPQEAFEQYTRASLLGSVEALARAARYYEDGLVVPKDTEFARKLYERAIAESANNFFASWRLGRMYLYGISVQKDLRKAKELLQGASNWFPDANTDLDIATCELGEKPCGQKNK